jgi:DNA (cytosine-5)-methyltransferase 1
MYKVISLFSGCGGADLGLVGGFEYLNQHYKSLPFEIVHASDIDKKAIATYRKNFEHPSFVEDIHNLTFENQKVDIVIGGFPCQPFSTVNPTKAPEKKESQLFWEMARVIKETTPKIFIAENVKGFYSLKQGYYFKLACEEFESLGYKLSYQILKASHYGIPQKRERIFIVGVRKDLINNFTFPQATHGNEIQEEVPLKRIVTNLYPENNKYFFSERAVAGVKNAKNNMKRALAQNLHEPCLTITSHLAKVSLNSRDPVLLVDPTKELYRRFTPKEAAGIQSFPESFEFVGSEADAYRQIGNAVPPVLMWHIGNAVVEALASQPTLALCKAM